MIGARVSALVIGLACGTFAAIALVGVERVGGEQKPIAGTGHDVSSPGTPACVYCHVQKDPTAQGVWESKPPVTGFLAGLKRLCFSCHDGTVTERGTYVFDSSRPEHPRRPGVRGQDCDRCHDPHGPRDPEFGFFLKLPGAADICRNCHATAGRGNHPVDVNAIARGIVPVDSAWDPNHGDFTGTRLWNQTGILGGDFVKCLTCHGPHGGYPGTAMLSVGYPAAEGTSLCLNCHFRGLPK